MPYSIVSYAITWHLHDICQNMAWKRKRPRMPDLRQRAIITHQVPNKHFALDVMNTQRFMQHQTSTVWLWTMTYFNSRWHEKNLKALKSSFRYRIVKSMVFFSVVPWNETVWTALCMLSYYVSVLLLSLTLFPLKFVCVNSFRPSHVRPNFVSQNNIKNQNKYAHPPGVFST